MAKDQFTQNESVTVRELYTLIDSKIGLVNSSINRLETKVDNLESGRLSSVEKDLSALKGQMMIIPTLIGIAISVFGFIVNRVIK